MLKNVSQFLRCRYLSHTVKPVLSGHWKKRPKIGFQLSLNAGQKYCRMLHESILQYFQPSLSYHLSLRPLSYLILSGHLRHLNVHSQLSSGATFLTFFDVHALCVSIEGSDEIAPLRRLIRAFPALYIDKYQHLMCGLMCFVSRLYLLRDVKDFVSKENVLSCCTFYLLIVIYIAC